MFCVQKNRCAVKNAKINWVDFRVKISVFLHSFDTCRCNIAHWSTFCSEVFDINHSPRSCIGCRSIAEVNAYCSLSVRVWLNRIAPILLCSIVGTLYMCRVWSVFENSLSPFVSVPRALFFVRFFVPATLLGSTYRRYFFRLPHRCLLLTLRFDATYRFSAFDSHASLQTVAGLLRKSIFCPVHDLDTHGTARFLCSFP